MVLPTAPKAARGLDDYSDKIPQQPPYIAYLSNLPYDVDEEEIADFFGNLKVLFFYLAFFRCTVAAKHFVLLSFYLHML